MNVNMMEHQICISIVFWLCRIRFVEIVQYQNLYVRVPRLYERPHIRSWLNLRLEMLNSICTSTVWYYVYELGNIKWKGLVFHYFTAHKWSESEQVSSWYYSYLRVFELFNPCLNDLPKWKTYRTFIRLFVCIMRNGCFLFFFLFRNVKYFIFWVWFYLSSNDKIQFFYGLHFSW